MGNVLPIFTDLEITSDGKQSIKRYFNSLSRNLPKNWCVKINPIDESNTLRVIEEQLCLQLPKFKDIRNQQTVTATIYLGLTINSIILLKTSFDIDIPKNESLELIGYTSHLLHNEILVPNKYYKSFTHSFKFGGPSDENWYKTDVRDTRAIKMYSKEEKITYFLSKNESVKSGDKEISYSAPNSIALSLSIIKKSIKRALGIHKHLISRNKNKHVSISLENRSELYDYFEEIQTSTIFSYTAVESFTNAAIPQDFTFEKTNDKGVKEIWNKSSIERWMPTSEKISHILPKIFNSDDITKAVFWILFKELEKLRNDIIHQKTTQNEVMLEAEIFDRMLSSNIFNIIQSSFDVIQFFYKLNNAHPYFPLGLGIAKFQVIEIDSMDKHFRLVDDVSQP